VNLWILSAIALLPPLCGAVLASARGPLAPRLVAVQFATSLATFLLLILSFGFDQASSADLALTLAILTLPGTLLMAVFAERWL
jgi:multisubunit Na+/H+ antiporter MnhF subunit